MAGSCLAISLSTSSVRKSAGFSGQKLCLFAHASLRFVAEDEAEDHQGDGVGPCP